MRFLHTIIISIAVQTSFAQVEESTITKVWSLSECIQYAIENNITIQNAELTKSEADVSYAASKSARLPNLSGSMSQNFINGQSIDPITSAFVNEQIHSTSVGVNSSLTLYQGNQLRNQIQLNEILVDQNSLYVEEARNSVVLSVVETYLQALYAKEGISIAEKNLEASLAEVETAKTRLDAGTIAMQEYTNALSQQSTNQYNLINAKNSFAQQLISLKQLLELGPDVNIDLEPVDAQSWNAVVPNKITVYNAALEFLPEYRATQIGIEASEKQLDIARGGYLPTVSLNGSLGTGYTSVQDLTFMTQFNRNFNQRIGVSVSIPIYDRGQTKSSMQKAKIAIDQSKIQEEIVRKQIYQKVEIAYQNVVATQEQMIAAEAASTSAEEAYKLAQAKYNLGALSATDLIISHNTFTNAQQNYLQAKYLNILYVQLLEFYQGNGIKL